MELTLNELVLGVLLGSMSLVLLFAFISRGHRLRGRARVSSRVVVCRLCLHAFEPSGRHAPVECPECGASNEPGHRRHGH